MAKMPTYESDVQAQGQLNVEKLSANDLAPAQGLEHLGVGIGETAAFLQKHASREDISQVAADGAQGHAQFLDLAQRQADQGVFNPDQFMESARQHFDLVTNGAQTAAGREYARKTG